MESGRQQNRHQEVGQSLIQQSSSASSSSKSKFCRCVLRVAEKNGNKCNKKKKWQQSELKCYNPYAVCAKSTKTTTGRRPCEYKFSNSDITAKQMKSYGYLNFKSYNEWATRKKRTKLYKLRAKKKIRQHIMDWYRSTNKPRV